MAARRRPSVGFLLLAAAGGAALLAGCRNAAPAPRAPLALVADGMGEERMPAGARRAGNLAKAHDGLAATRWTTGTPVAPGFFVQVALAREEDVAAVAWDAGPAARDYPRAFEIEISRDGEDWTEVTPADARITVGRVTRVVFRPPRRTRYVMITALKAEPYWWSIHELTVAYARERY